MILGIDEVGRGPWAGPLVVGAVVLGGAMIEGLTDSKKLSKKRREELDVIIREQATGYGLGWVHADEIDEVGLAEALRLATIRAVEQVDTPYYEIIIDGTINFLADTSKGQYVTTMKKADLLVPSVSAASIIAKVARDKYMAEQDELYDGYKFASHVGYGTAVHRAAIESRGVTPLHRLSFAPLAKYKAVSASANIQPPTAPPGNHMGGVAEDEAASYLIRLGHDIVERN
jgi:ribonuclease HII